jgi:TRAP-type C4-dicarboxylate transport system substrate-binding protein
LQEKGMEVNEVDKASFAEAAAKVRALYVDANGSELLDLIEAQ